MRYRYRLVDRIPKQMDEGIVYHTEEFELAGLLCACGCGHRITLLVPDSHRVSEEDGYATISPSIGVLDSQCKSHYFIVAGEVEWLPAFSGAQAARIMHAQIARHAGSDRAPTTWWQKAKAALDDLVTKLGKLFTR